jgi:hypothetical protein
LGVVAAHLALSLGPVDWAVLEPGSVPFQVIFRLLLPLVVAARLWAGRRLGWWALLGLFTMRAVGELLAGVYGGRQPDLGWESWPVRKAWLLVAGYVALAPWVVLPAGLRRLSRVSGV